MRCLFYLVSKGDLRVRCADVSPYSAIHQVIPGGQTEETVQSKPVREQLENRNTQVYVIPSTLGEEQRLRDEASVTLTLLIES